MFYLVSGSPIEVTDTFTLNIDLTNIKCINDFTNRLWKAIALNAYLYLDPSTASVHAQRFLEML